MIDNRAEFRFQSIRMAQKMLDHVGPELQDALRAARQDRRLARERAMKRLQQARSRGEGQDLETKATKKAEAAKKKMEEGGK